MGVDLEVPALEAAAEQDPGPGRSRSASQAWLNQIAFSEPLPSATVASTIRRLRRRVGRTRAVRTSPTIVARSPIRSSAISVGAALSA